MFILAGIRDGAEMRRGRNADIGKSYVYATNNNLYAFCFLVNIVSYHVGIVK